MSQAKSSAQSKSSTPSASAQSESSDGDTIGSSGDEECKYFDDDDGSDDLFFSMIDSDEDTSSDDEAEDLIFLKQQQRQIIWTPSFNSFLLELGVDIAKIECGAYHSICLSESGECWAFGSNFFGNVGSGEFSGFGEGIHEPLKLKIDDKIIDIAAGTNHNLLLTEQNQILSFGLNGDGQCSMKIIEHRIASPIVVSKEEQFGVGKNSFVEKVLCVNDKSMIIVDPYRRANV